MIWFNTSSLILCDIAQVPYLPPFRDGAQLGVDEAAGEEVGDAGGEAGVAAFGFSVHGVEIDEPGFEDGAGDALQRRVHAPVELNLVVERAEDVGD